MVGCSMGLKGEISWNEAVEPPNLAGDVDTGPSDHSEYEVASWVEYAGEKKRFEGLPANLPDSRRIGRI